MEPLGAHFEKELVESRDYIRSIVRRRANTAHTEQDVEDLVGEILIKAWSGRESFRGESSIRTWLTRIAYHATFDFDQRNRTRKGVFQNSLASLENKVCDGRHGDRKVELQETIGGDDVYFANEIPPGDIEQALAMCPGHLRSVVLLYASGRTYDEIAAITNVPVGTAKSRHFRAQRRLRAILQGDVQN